MSLGPLKSTLIDYLRLIWQERTRVIVMLTNLREDCKNKCEQYWPHDVSDQLVIGPFKVMLVKEENLLDYVIRSLTIKVIHYEYFHTDFGRARIHLLIVYMSYVFIGSLVHW